MVNETLRESRQVYRSIVERTTPNVDKLLATGATATSNPNKKQPLMKAPAPVIRHKSPVHTKFLTAQGSPRSPAVFASPDQKKRTVVAPLSTSPLSPSTNKTVPVDEEDPLAPSPRVTTVVTPRNEVITSSSSGTVMRRFLPSSSSASPDLPERRLTQDEFVASPPSYLDPHHHTQLEEDSNKRLSLNTRTHRRQSSDLSAQPKSPTGAHLLTRFATVSRQNSRQALISSPNAAAASAASPPPLSRQPSVPSSVPFNNHHPATLQYAWDKFCALAASEFTPSDLKLVSCDTLREIMSRYNVILPEEVAHIEAHWALLQDQMTSRRLDSSGHGSAPYLSPSVQQQYGRFASGGGGGTSRSPSGGTVLNNGVALYMQQDSPLPFHHASAAAPAAAVMMERSPMRGRSVSPSMPDGRAVHPYDMDLRTTVPPAPKLRRTAGSSRSPDRSPSNPLQHDGEKRHGSLDPHNARPQGLRSGYKHIPGAARASGIAHIEVGPDNLFGGFIQPHASVDSWKAVRHHVDVPAHPDKKHCVKSQHTIERECGPSQRVLASDHGINPGASAAAARVEVIQRPIKRTFSRINQSSLKLV